MNKKQSCYDIYDILDDDILLHKTFGPFPNNKWSPKVRASAASRHIQASKSSPNGVDHQVKKNLLLNYGPSETCVSRVATSLLGGGNSNKFYVHL